MKTSFIESVLNYQGFGYAYFSSDLGLLTYNSVFKEFCSNKTLTAQSKIMDLIPETIGLEDVFQELQSGIRKNFNLDFVNRDKADSQVKFYNLYFYSAKECNFQLFCFVEDVTELAQKNQEIIQKQYEIKILESLLASRREFQIESIIGDSEPIRRLRSLITKVAIVPSTTVLLQGETGTGKNLVARIIHANSKNADGPFIEINSAAIPETLLESELFGYEKGAFTHAVTSRRGLLEEADKGTLFLDEIGELSLNVQAKLLSFLETGKFRRLGSNQEREVRIRLIAATNRDLNDMVKKEKFREDLFYRLHIVTLSCPPLRELGEDILQIAHHYIQVFNVEFKKKIKGFTKSGEKTLLSYNWPGNVRELANCIERTMIFIEKNWIDSQDLLIQSKHNSIEASQWSVPMEGIHLDEVEKQLILSSLKRAKGNKAQAARLLGISRDTLLYRMEKHNLS